MAKVRSVTTLQSAGGVSTARGSTPGASAAAGDITQLHVLDQDSYEVVTCRAANKGSRRTTPEAGHDARWQLRPAQLLDACLARSRCDTGRGAASQSVRRCARVVIRLPSLQLDLAARCNSTSVSLQSFWRVSGFLDIFDCSLYISWEGAATDEQTGALI